MDKLFVLVMTFILNTLVINEVKNHQKGHAVCICFYSEWLICRVNSQQWIINKTMVHVYTYRYEVCVLIIII